MDAYTGVVGSPPVGHGLKTDFRETLPGEIRTQLVRRVTDMDETFATVTEHVRATSQSVLFHRGTCPSISRFGPERQDQDEDEGGYDEERTRSCAGGARPEGDQDGLGELVDLWELAGRDEIDQPGQQRGFER